MYITRSLFYVCVFDRTELGTDRSRSWRIGADAPAVFGGEAMTMMAAGDESALRNGEGRRPSSRVCVAGVGAGPW